MTILSTELINYKSAVVTNDSTNGGIMSAVSVPSNSYQNVFPNVFKAERLAGSTMYRKLFAKVQNSLSETLYDASYFFDGPTAAEDHVIFFPGTQRDTQATLVETTFYGSGLMTADAAASSSVIVVDAGDASLTDMFQVGTAVRISNMPTITSETGTEDIGVIDTIDSVSDSIVTFTLETALLNSYTVAEGTKVSAIYEVGDLSTAVDNTVKTSTSGTVDTVNYPPELNNLGTTEDTWTVTFLSATTYAVSGEYAGDVGSGGISSAFAPVNADFSQPFFSIPSGMWGGTWATDDTFVFQTHPAAVPIWEKRIVPAGCGSLTNNKITKVTSGETA